MRGFISKKDTKKGLPPSSPNDVLPFSPKNEKTVIDEKMYVQLLNTHA